MNFNDFLENIFENPTDPDYAVASVRACRKFERENYKHLGSFTADQHQRFYEKLLFYLGIQSNLNPLTNLDSKSKEILQRNLDSAATLLPNQSVLIASISKTLV